MSYSVFDESDIKKKVPNRVTKRIKENMDKYNMCLSDAFKKQQEHIPYQELLYIKRL